MGLALELALWLSIDVVGLRPSGIAHLVALTSIAIVAPGETAASLGVRGAF